MIQQISRFKLKVKNFHGFTLIELIVVFSILSILSVVGVASFVNYSRSQALLSDRQKLITVLNTAKANASSQLKGQYDCSSGGGVLNGYSVSIDTTDLTHETYSLNLECSSQGVTSYPLVTYPLSKNITFDLTVTKVTKILFPLFTGGAIFTGSHGSSVNDPAQITLTGYGNKFTTTIAIYQTGIIKIIK